MSLNRPESLNSQTPHTWTALRAIGAWLPATVRVVVVRGQGRAFSAGLDRAMLSPGGVPGVPDLMALAAAPAGRTDDHIRQWQGGFGWLARPDIVSVAVVQGYAIGGGFQLALACDLRVLADDAVFSMAETGLGIVPDLGGTKRLVELVGYSRAAEICLTSRRVPADEAYRLGLASVLTPLAALEDTTAALVASLLAAPRDAVIETKALLLGAAQRSQAEQEAAERAAQYRRLRDLAGLD